MANGILSQPEIADALVRLRGWSIGEDGVSLVRSYRFNSFAAAVAFMVEVAPSAERLNHHPEWANVHDQVDVRLTTHDAGCLTHLDLELAAAMERAASGRTI